MNRLALAVVVVAALVGACNKSKQDPQSGGGTGSGSAGTAPLARKIVVSFGVQQQPARGDVFLQTTDETGRQVSHAVGTFPGQCSVIAPAAEMRAITGVLCKDGATGTELHAVVRDDSIIVLKMRWDDGVTPDPMAREEITRIQVATGTAVEAG